MYSRSFVCVCLQIYVSLVLICFQSFIHHEGIFLLIGICDLNGPIPLQKQEKLDFLFSLVAALLSGVT